MRKKEGSVLPEKETVVSVLICNLSFDLSIRFTAKSATDDKIHNPPPHWRWMHGKDMSCEYASEENKKITMLFLPTMRQRLCCFTAFLFFLAGNAADEQTFHIKDVNMQNMKIS